jgi:hypothetical protein
VEVVGEINGITVDGEVAEFLITGRGEFLFYHVLHLPFICEQYNIMGEDSQVENM